MYVYIHMYMYIVHAFVRRQTLSTRWMPYNTDKRKDIGTSSKVIFRLTIFGGNCGIGMRMVILRSLVTYGQGMIVTSCYVTPCAGQFLSKHLINELQNDRVGG